MKTDVADGSMKIGILMATLLLALVSEVFGAGLPAHGVAPSGTYKQLMNVRVGGFRRSYLVHVPEGYDGTATLPLVVVLHGAFSTASKMEKQTGFSQLADREGFLVAYPNGIGLFSLLRHWNSGHCCGRARKKAIDDVGFVAGVIEEVAGSLRVDKTRIYLVGHSNGGMLVHRFAAEKAEVVAAIAPISATIGGRPSAEEPEWRVPTPGAPVPVLSIHGRADEHVPYQGGHGEHSHGTIQTISVQDSLELWVENNECETAPSSELLYQGRVVRQVWTDCVRDTEVVLYTLEDWGHDWPGGPFFETLAPDDPLRAFDAAETIWDFLQQHRRWSPRLSR
ncbi:MAG: PHB depolymerase family esterase [Thermoanaerobaculia bacterium]